MLATANLNAGHHHFKVKRNAHFILATAAATQSCHKMWNFSDVSFPMQFLSSGFKGASRKPAPNTYVVGVRHLSLKPPDWCFTQESLLQVFPIAHQYAFDSVLQNLLLSVAKLGNSLTGSSTGPTSLLVWLQLAESLQLDGLKQTLLSAIPGWNDDNIHRLLYDVVGLESLNKTTLVQLLGRVVQGRLELSESYQRICDARLFEPSQFDPTGYMNCGWKAWHQDWQWEAYHI